MIGTNIHNLIKNASNPPSSEQIESIKQWIKECPHAIDTPDRLGHTPCHVAAISQQGEIVELLVRVGKARLGVKDNQGKTPFDVASQEKTRTVIRQLFFGSESPAKKMPLKEINFLGKLLEGLKISSKNSKESFARNSGYQRGATSGSRLFTPRVRSHSVIAKSMVASEGTVLQPGVPTGATLAGMTTKTELETFFQNDDIANFKQYLKHQKNKMSPTIKGQPLLLAAFCARATEIFLWLIQNTGTIRVYATDGTSITDLLTSDPERMNFLERINERIWAELGSKEHFEERIAAVKEDLFAKEEKCEGLLLEAGLTDYVIPERLSFLSQRQVEKDNVFLQLCSGMDLEGKTYQFHPQTYRSILIGLLAEQDINQFFKDCLRWYSSLLREQKLILLYLVKEALRWDNFSFNYCKKKCQKKIKLLGELAAGDGLREIGKTLLELWELRKKLRDPLIDAAIDIVAMATRGRSREQLIPCSQMIAKEDASLLAEELRAISLQFFHQVKLWEFKNGAWATENEKRSQQAPTICAQLTLFNEKLTHYFLSEIFTKVTEKKRAAVVELYVNTIKKLLQHEIPDFNSAMMLSAVLEHRLVGRVIDFSSLGRETRLEWENIKAIFSNWKNYSLMREKIHNCPTAIPFLGILLRDLTLAKENAPHHKLTVVGEVLKKIQIHLESLSEHFLPLRTDLLVSMHQMAEITEEAIELLAFNYVPLTITLEASTSAVFVQKILATSIDKKYLLKVMYNGQLHEGLEALGSVLQWIREQIKSNKIKHAEAAGLWTAIRHYETAVLPSVLPRPQSPILLSQFDQRHSRRSLSGETSIHSHLASLHPDCEINRTSLQGDTSLHNSSSKGGGLPNELKP